MWGFWIMAPQSAAALPGTPVADDDHAGGGEGEGYRQLHKEGIGSDERRWQYRPKPKDWNCGNLVEKKRRRSDGDVEGMERRREMPLRWQIVSRVGHRKRAKA